MAQPTASVPAATTSNTPAAAATPATATATATAAPAPVVVRVSRATVGALGTFGSTGVEGAQGVGTASPHAILVSPKPDAFPRINHIAEEFPPHVTCSPDEFLTRSESNPELRKQLKNKVRKCAGCGKPNAFTLTNCNACGASLASVPISFTDNVFTAFIYGIEKGAFPFTISIRKQSEGFITFDDLLSLSPCHVNSIPTTQFIPDWRYLLRRPAEGLALIRQLHSHSSSVAVEQFLANPEYRSRVLSPAANKMSPAEIIAHTACGFNYPPSQYQLHLQFIVPPLMPFQYYMYLIGNHFTKGRFFPFEYVEAVLKLNEVYPVDDDTPIETIMAHFATKGVDYDKIHQECYDRYGASHRLLSNWLPDSFNGFVANNKLFTFTGPDPANPEILTAQLDAAGDPKAIQAADKLALQNFGRPYKTATATSGTYYAHAKSFPGGMAMW
ncbi:hypothetical protein Pelo_11903 [Pelomyxa schiedti]|nr:hypothetical protein Pelo_11903 [Pelomyxa schiedti]